MKPPLIKSAVGFGEVKVWGRSDGHGVLKFLSHLGEKHGNKENILSELDSGKALKWNMPVDSCSDSGRLGKFPCVLMAYIRVLILVNF